MCPVIPCIGPAMISGFSLPVANPILLLTIKAIHINYPRKFAKNIRDYIVLRQLVISNPVQSLIDARMGSKPMHPDWVRAVRDDCRDLSVAFQFHQWGTWSQLHGSCLDEF